LYRPITTNDSKSSSRSSSNSSSSASSPNGPSGSTSPRSPGWTKKCSSLLRKERSGTSISSPGYKYVPMPLHHSQEPPSWWPSSTSRLNLAIACNRFDPGCSNTTRNFGETADCQCFQLDCICEWASRGSDGISTRSISGSNASCDSNM